MTPAESETVARCYMIAGGRQPIAGAMLAGALRGRLTPEQRAALLVAVLLGRCGLGFI